MLIFLFLLHDAIGCGRKMASLVFWNRGDLCRKIQLSLLLWATKSYGNIPCREHNGKVNGLWQQHSCPEIRTHSVRQQKVKVQPFTFDFRLIFLPRAENLLHGENGEHSSLFWKVITVLPLILYQCCLCHVEYLTHSCSKLEMMYVYYKFIFWGVLFLNNRHGEVWCTPNLCVTLATDSAGNTSGLMTSQTTLYWETGQPSR